MAQIQSLLITGGTGFVGRSLLRELAENHGQRESNIKVTVLSRSPEQFLTAYPEFKNLGWLSLMTGDILVPEGLSHAERFDSIIHAASSASPIVDSNLLGRFDEIVTGTRNLLEFAVNSSVQRFLFISSGAVYGTQPLHIDRIPEDWHSIPDPLKPASTYGVAKHAAEHLCALYNQSHGLQTVIARCFAFVGPDLPLDMHFAIGNFIRDALWRDEITVAGDGSPLRSYLDQHDLARWLLTLLKRGKSGQAYNVGSDQAFSIAELARLVRDIVAPNKPIRILGKVSDNNEANLYIPSIQKARRELGLDVRVPLEVAIRAAADAAKQRRL